MSLSDYVRAHSFISQDINCYLFVFQMNMTIIKNPGLGFSVAGGVGLQGNPYKPHDEVS